MSSTQVEHTSDSSSDEDGLDDIAGIYDEIEEEDRDEECLIGFMRVHGDGRLQVFAADPERANFLQRVTERMNGKRRYRSARRSRRGTV